MSAARRSSAGRRVVVVGGTSEIALAIVRELQSSAPREVVLIGRDPRGLELAVEGLIAAGCASVSALELDALQTESHERIVGEAFDRLGGVDIAILAVGVLGERGGLPDDVAGALEVLEVNVVGAGSLLIQLARRLRDAGGGALVVLSSVAAERPRRGNVVYGASKAALDSLAQGLGDALYDDGVRVLVVRPGFVHTRMTRGLEPAPLATTAEGVATVVVRGLERDAHTVWAPQTLRWLMLIARMLPRALFRRMKQ
ncbi:MAG: SDR family NAD(P)-dependent oxidoreductase [Solirubrobacterales bacterium]